MMEFNNVPEIYQGDSDESLWLEIQEIDRELRVINSELDDTGSGG